MEVMHQMRRVYSKDLCPGHFIKTVANDGSTEAWGEVQRIQDCMVLVRSSTPGTPAAWFDRSRIREFYERVDDTQCLQVDHHKNTRIDGNCVSITGAGDTAVSSQRHLALQGASVQVSGEQVDLVAGRCSARAGAVEVRCGDSRVEMTERALEAAVPLCRLLGNLEVRGISFVDAIMRIDQDLQALRGRVSDLERELSAARTPGRPRTPPRACAADAEPAAG